MARIPVQIRLSVEQSERLDRLRRNSRLGEPSRAAICLQFVLDGLARHERGRGGANRPGAKGAKGAKRAG